MYIEVPTRQFKKELNAAYKQGKDLSTLETVLDIIKSGKPLPPEYKEHYLTGKYKGCRECHLEPNWLLIYEIDKKQKKLYLYRLGSHSELFESLDIKDLNNILNEYLK